MFLNMPNIYKPLSKVLAAAVGVNLLIFTAPKTEVKVDADIEKEMKVSSTTAVSVNNIQSDLETFTQELLFNEVDNENKDENQALDIRELPSMIDLNNVNEPSEEKIATDWVEPEPPKPTPSQQTQSQQITYNVRVYSDEEIQANALKPYKVPQNDWRMTYYFNNMVDAMATPDMSDIATDDNIYLLAKIIHAEICTLGDEARRCVGTVIINRVWNSDHPDTLYGVINEPSQFSTKNTKKVPCQECMAAAYDVLVNGYRSFPHYVDSFQCKWDGYFRGHNTYIAFNDGKYKTYFSYKAGKQVYVESD